MDTAQAHVVRDAGSLSPARSVALVRTHHRGFFCERASRTTGCRRLIQHGRAQSPCCLSIAGSARRRRGAKLQTRGCFVDGRFPARSRCCWAKLHGGDVGGQSKQRARREPGKGMRRAQNECVRWPLAACALPQVPRCTGRGLDAGAARGSGQGAAHLFLRVDSGPSGPRIERHFGRRKTGRYPGEIMARTMMARKTNCHKRSRTRSLRETTSRL